MLHVALTQEKSMLPQTTQICKLDDMECSRPYV